MTLGESFYRWLEDMQLIEKVVLVAIGLLLVTLLIVAICSSCSECNDERLDCREACLEEEVMDDCLRRCEIKMNICKQRGGDDK